MRYRVNKLLVYHVYDDAHTHEKPETGSLRHCSSGGGGKNINVLLNVHVTDMII